MIMKKSKKRIALPLIVIAISLCAIVAICVFTTPLVYYLYEAKYTYADGETEAPSSFDMANKIGKICETVYKVHPSLDNLQRVYQCYSTGFVYFDGIYKGEQAPEGYLEKSLKYAKLRYETEFDEEAEKKYAAVPVAENYEKQWRISNGADYMTALYLNGKKDEAMRLYEKIASTINEKDMERPVYGVFKSFFYLVYSDAKDDTQRNWVLEKEAVFDKNARQKESYDKYFSKHDSLFTNPDYKTFISGEWPEFQDGYNDYD